MHAVILQHVAFEGAGAITAWLEAQHAVVDVVRLGCRDALPLPLAHDLAVVMGGPMGVGDVARFPWLIAEREWLAARAAADAPLLGVCLGAQLIAAALGARVYCGARREIGWFDIFGARPVAGDFVFPKRLRAFHWHDDTFDLPSSARRLASSAACREQAFQVGRRVVGLQCHLEATAQTVRAMTSSCAREMAGGGEWVQSADAMRAAPDTDYRALHVALGRLLDYLVTG